MIEKNNEQIINNYDEFVRNIKNGKFVLPYCKNCKKCVWPPFDYCRFCFSNLTVINYGNRPGKLTETFLSRIDKVNNVHVNIALVDFNGIRLLGSLTKNLENKNIQGKFVKMKRCGFDNGQIYFEFELI